MDGFNPDDIARIQRRMRKLNSSGTSNEFTPPQNTPPAIPTLTSNGPLHNPRPIPAEEPINEIERQFREMEIRESIAMMEIPDAVVSHLKQFQVEHVQNLLYALKKHEVALDTSDTGTGKTYSAIAAAASLDLRVIIICPKAVIPNWHNVCTILDVEQLMIVNYEALRGGKYFVTLEDFLDDERIDCPYISLVRETVVDSNGHAKMKVTGVTWSIPENTLVIFDEAHTGKNGLNNSIPTINSKIMVMAKPQLDSQRNVYGLFLSATITDKLENFDVIGYLLGLFPTYSKKSYKQFTDKLQGDSLKAIHQLLYPARASRMDIKQIKLLTGDSQFKKNDIQAKTYTLDAASCAEIEAAHDSIRQAMTALRQKQLVDGQHPLVVILRARQRIELLKIPIFVEETQTYVNEGKSVIIFVNFLETMDTIVQKLNTTNVLSADSVDVVRGGQSGEEREDIVQRFQNDEIRVLVCIIEAGGVGISLHDIRGEHARASLISPTWKAIHLKQCLGRGYRANAKSDMIQRVIYVKSEDGQPSIEQMMCENMNEKLKNIALLNTGNLEEYHEV